jgi:hypothetical protein
MSWRTQLANMCCSGHHYCVLSRQPRAFSEGLEATFGYAAMQRLLWWASCSLHNGCQRRALAYGSILFCTY